MGRKSRDKGARGEREAAHMLATVWPEARRGLQPQGGGIAPDVEGTPLWVEVKTRATVRPVAALEQAERDSDGRPALAWLREDHRRPQVALRARTLVAMVRGTAELPSHTVVYMDAQDFLDLCWSTLAEDQPLTPSHSSPQDTLVPQPQS